MKKYPVVVIAFDDHSADMEGEAKPFKFVAVGILLKETDMGYVLGHWVKNQEEQSGDFGEVTTYIAKVKGLSIKRMCMMQFG